MNHQISQTGSQQFVHLMSHRLHLDGRNRRISYYIALCALCICFLMSLILHSSMFVCSHPHSPPPFSSQWGTADWDECACTWSEPCGLYGFSCPEFFSLFLRSVLPSFNSLSSFRIPASPSICLQERPIIIQTQEFVAEMRILAEMKIENHWTKYFPREKNRQAYFFPYEN